MKKTIGIVIVLILAAIAWQQRFVLQKFFHKIPELALSPIAQDLKQDIFTPPPLVSSEDHENSFLTRVGVIEQTNLQRQQNGSLPQLVENTSLDQAALLKVKDMFAKQYFEHISPSGVGPSGLAKQVGYDFISIGENLALGNFENDRALVEAWMNSPGHRANILNTKYEEIGVAVMQGMYQGHTTWLAVQEFGKPSSSCPAVDANLKSELNSLQADIKNLEAELKAQKASLDSLSPSTQQEYDAYNQKVKEYNDKVHIYNNELDQLKQITDKYNSQVKARNACAE